MEVAIDEAPPDWPDVARRVLGVEGPPMVDLLAYHDAPAGQHRFAVFTDDRMVGALFLDRAAVSVSRNWLAALTGETMPDRRDRLRVLAGASAARRTGCGGYRVRVHGYRHQPDLRGDRK